MVAGYWVIRASCQSGEPELSADVFRGGAFGAEGGQRPGVVALGEAAAGRVADERVVVPDRDGQAEERLQQAVQRRGVAEVGAADDVGDALVGVVDDDGEVVGGADVAAGEDGVAGGESAGWVPGSVGPVSVQVRGRGGG